MNCTLTDEEIRTIATDTYKAGELSWLGFDLDEQGKYTIPILSICHYQLVRAALKAIQPNIEALALLALTRHFDTFVQNCMNASGEPTVPSHKALMQARACLPTSSSCSFKPKDKP